MCDLELCSYGLGELALGQGYLVSGPAVDTWPGSLDYFLELERQSQITEVHSMAPCKAWEWALGPGSARPDQVRSVG